MEDRIKILLARRHEGKCSEAELEELYRWYDIVNLPSEGMPEAYNADMDSYLENKYQEFNALKDRRNGKKRRKLPVFLKIAAACILFLGALYYYKIVFNSHVQKLPAAVTYNAAGQSDDHSRYLVLPDSSIVILHAGSTLQLLDSTFNGKTREVALTGQAYFDIRHMDKKPFIVHTGEVKVTVLGTAFNIKQQADSVAVTVTEGKVQVADRNKVVSTLTPDQQVVYHTVQQQAIRQQLPAQAVAKWIKAGLNFNDESLASIAKQLEERYGVHITFTNEAVAKCRISVTSPFAGTENINDILAFICPIVNATYTSDGNKILIDGKGCD